MRSFLASAIVTFLCSCASHGPQVSAPQRSERGSERDLRVMTFNLRVRKNIDGPNIWDKRRDLLVERIHSFDPDLLGTQEGLDFMELFLREQLRDYTFFGASRSDGGQVGEMCGVFYRTARFELLDSGHFWLSNTPDKPGSLSWGAHVPRMVTWVKLRPRNGGPSFCWFNTHFDAFNPHVRTQSAELLRDQMPRIAGSMPCMVTGDFNSNADTTAYRTLLAQQQSPAVTLHDAFRDTHKVATREEGTVHFFTGRRGGWRIDWILASSRFQTQYAEIDHTRGPHGYPSDHFPVTAVFRAHAAQ